MKSTFNNLKQKKTESDNNLPKCDDMLLNVTTLVEPLNFEVVYQQNKTHVSNDLYKSLIKFPDCDATIKRLPKNKIYFNNAVPEFIIDIQNNANLSKICVEFFNSDWIYTIYKEISFNGEYFKLIGIANYLPKPNRQNFIVDEGLNGPDGGTMVFKSKGTYFENKLAICDLEQYHQCMKKREEELSRNLSSVSHDSFKMPKLLQFCLREHIDGNKILNEAMARDGHEPIIIYLECVETLKGIGMVWIKLSLKGNKDYYLFAGDKENRDLWLKHLGDATGEKKVMMSQDSLDRFEDNVQGMLTKFIQETEKSAADTRRKDRQNILLLYSDIRNQIIKKAPPSVGLFDNIPYEANLTDSEIRHRLQQPIPRRLIKLTTRSFFTGLHFIPDTPQSSNYKILTPEPFFISMCLVHLHDGCRISEEFYWNPNPQEIENMLPTELFINQWYSRSDSPTTPHNPMTPNGLPTLPDSVLQNIKSYLMKSAYPLEKICLLIKVEKVLSGRISDVSDKYCKNGNVDIQRKNGNYLATPICDVKNGVSLHKTMSKYCANIGHYRMPFAWGACRLSVNEHKHGVKLYKYDGNKTSDSELIKLAQSLLTSSGNESSSKYSVISAFLEFEIQEINEKNTHLIDDTVNSEYVMKINDESSVSNSDVSYCKEVREFNFNPTLTNFGNQISKSMVNGASNSNQSGSINGDNNDLSPSEYPSSKTAPDNCPTGFYSAKFHDAPDSQMIQANSIQSSDVRPEDLVSPVLDFSHTLYLYPRSINFSKSQVARNISCFIELKDSDKMDAVPLKVIYSRPSNKQPCFDNWANLSVLYHEYSPQFNEEIKLALPLNLHSKHHLLFRFVKVSCDTAQKPNARERPSKEKPLEVCVGYSWLSLLDERNNLKNGCVELPVAKELTNGYLETPHTQNPIQWLENQKSIFSVILTPQSSIYTQDNLLHEFFKICGEKLERFVSSISSECGDGTVENVSRRSSNESMQSNSSRQDDTIIKNAIKSIYALNVTTLVQFLGPIFNQLLHVVVATSSSHPDISRIAINTMMTLARSLRMPVIDNINERARKRYISILKSYIKYSFDAEKFVPTRSKKSVHECLVNTIINILSPPFQDHQNVTTLLYNSFVLYNIIIKSMIQTVSKQTKWNNDNRTGEKHFSRLYQDNLQKMIHLIINRILNLVMKSHPSGNSNQQAISVYGPGSSLGHGESIFSINSQIINPNRSDKRNTETLTNSVYSDVNNNSSASQSNSFKDSSNRKDLKSTGRVQKLEMMANEDLARFFCRLLNVIDRGFVLQRIRQYMLIINERINEYGPDHEDLCLMKFDFIEILINHEHYIPLSLINITNPGERATPPELQLTEEYCKQHYLTGLLLQQIHQQMTDTYSDSITRRRPILILRNLLVKHTVDERYRGNNHKQTYITALYLPFINIVLENKSALCDAGVVHHNRHPTITGITNHQIDSNRPISGFSGGNADSISTVSSFSSGGKSGDSNSIGGSGCNSRYSNTSYLNKDGHVESSILQQISGLSDTGILRSRPSGVQNTLSGRMIGRGSINSSVESDTSSINSSNTVIGIEEYETEHSDDNDDGPIATSGAKEKNNLDNYDDMHIVAPKSNTLSKVPHPSESNSIGRKSGFFPTFRKGTNSNPRINASENPSQVLRKNRIPQIKSTQCLNDKTQKDLFLCFIHILGTVSREDLKTTISKLTIQDRLNFLDILILSIQHLKYSGKTNIDNFQSIGLGSNKVKLRSKHQKSASKSDQFEDKAVLDGNLSVEVGLVTLEVLTAFCSVFKQEILSYSPDHQFFRKLISIYLTLLNDNQSEIVLCHTFVSLRVFTMLFAKVLFESCHTVLCELSLHALRFCDSSFPSVRSEASGFLYRMMRISFDTFNKQGFNRVHLQMIVAVSKLDKTVGPSFEKSLHYIKGLAEAEKQKAFGHTTAINKSKKPTGRTGSLVGNPTSNGQIPPIPKPKPAAISGQHSVKLHLSSFFDEVIDLTDRIRTVLMATMHMNEHKDDPEMLVDLQYSLAKSYSSNPALRRTWLEKIYSVHKKTGSRTEMAICKAHIAAMISEYLKRKDLLTEKYPLGCKSFHNISPNIPIEEGSMSDDTSLLEVHYSKEEVVSLLREVAHEFDSAGLWEVLRHVYSLLIPIYENKREYEHLAEIYRHLSDGYLRIKDAELSNQRLIGSYYRVIFYGKPFENLAGKVFIYRLSGGTQLNVALDQLEKLFIQKYGEKNVMMISENFVDRSSLIDHDKACIQITHVEPYFDQEELELAHSVRCSTFEKHYNINRFMFETPFIKQTLNMKNEHDESELKSRQTEDLSIQWKRRTILTVQSSFPHLKRRLEVVCSKEIDFSPIERAIDEIKAKNRQLDIYRVLNVVNNNGTDVTPARNTATVAKSTGAPTARASGGNEHLLMDMYLMGALLPQVNQGPMAYARVFLDKQTNGHLPKDKVQLLKIEFMIFLTQCHLLLENYYQLMSQVHEPKFAAMKEALDKYRMELIKLIEEEVILDEEKKVISSKTLTEIIYSSLNSQKNSKNNSATI